MVRQIVVPEDTRLVLDLPEEFIGKRVEITATPLEETESSLAEPTDAEREARRQRLEKALEGYRINMGGYKFDRDEANDYD